MYREKSKQPKKIFEKFQSALLDPPGRYTGNDFLFKGGLRGIESIGTCKQKQGTGISFHSRFKKRVTWFIVFVCKHTGKS